MIRVVAGVVITPTRLISGMPTWGSVFGRVLWFFWFWCIR